MHFNIILLPTEDLCKSDLHDLHVWNSRRCSVSTKCTVTVDSPEDTQRSPMDRIHPKVSPAVTLPHSFMPRSLTVHTMSVVVT